MGIGSIGIYEVKILQATQFCLRSWHHLIEHIRVPIRLPLWPYFMPFSKQNDRPIFVEKRQFSYPPFI